jgi:DNA-binding NarL/FixJ family response regulator
VTAQHPDILTVRDAEILRLLNTRVIAIGVYRKSFTVADVVRVVNQRLPQPEPARVRHLHPAPAPSDQAHEVTVPAGQAEVLHELCTGATNAEIAARLGLAEDTIKTQLGKARQAIGARDRAHAIALILGNQVRVVSKVSSRRKKAS